MKKLVLLLPLLLAACANNDGQGSISQAVVKPLLENECKVQLNNRQEWRVVSMVLTNAKKLEIEQKVCGCVSEEGTKNMTAENTIGLVNPNTRTQTAATMAAQSIGGCVKRFITN
ncbi:MAG: hypothetical protein IK065_00915 [Neisseriaceae bacterium]|nr:hypothetical protein [Neisseriaceae bacterium]